LKADYDYLLDNEKLWKYAGDENPYIRKAIYNFLKVTLTKWPGMTFHDNERPKRQHANPQKQK
jgi:hypothetical protein